MKQAFFYTTDTPHEYSYGRQMHFWTPPPEMRPIASLEEASELAAKAARGKPGYMEYLLEGSPVMQSRKDALAAGESTAQIDDLLDMLTDLMLPDVIKLAELWNIS